MRLRGATPHLRSEAEAGRTRCPRGGGQEELSHIRDQGPQPRVPGCDSTGAAERRYSMSEVRSHGREELPISKEQWLCGEGLEELLHVQGQEGKQ